MMKALGNKALVKQPARAAEVALSRRQVTRADRPTPIGNQALLRRLSPSPVGWQPKLAVGALDAPAEQEADQAAEQVMRMAPSSSPAIVGHRCDRCDDDGEIMQRKPSAAPPTAPPIVDTVLSSPGKPFDPATHDFMASRFGTDFSHIRIHTDADAAASARSVGALAYTVGGNIVFGAGAYAPGADSGRRLIAHELAHTVQQGAGATLRRVPDITDCLAQTDDILPPHVGLVTVIAREQELATKLGADYEPFKKLIQARVDARTIVCQHGVPGVLALWNTRTAQGIIDVPAATAALAGGVAPPAPAPAAVPAVTPTAGADDFEINRVGRSTASRLLFARGSAAITASAQIQIDQLKSAHTAGIRLVGYTSTDEAATLAQSRADAVKAALAAPPDALTIGSATGNAPANAEKSEFVESRGVDVIIGSAAPATADCTTQPATQPCPTMDPETQTRFQEAHTIAKDAMADAVAAVAATPTADNTAKIDRFFGGHDAATLGTLQANLGALNTHVINLPAETDCGGACDKGGCAKSAIAYNNGNPAASHTTICVPTFKELGSNGDRARNLIHETAHGTSPLGGTAGAGTQDLAYRHERMLLELPAAERLRNSDSYALFVLFVHEAKTTSNPTAVPPGIKTPENDKFTGFAPTDPETPAFKLALAMMEKRLTWSKDHVGQLYGQVVEIAAGRDTWATVGAWAKDLMTEAARHFPLTAPPAQSTVTDQIRIAAMLDRYQRMSATSKNDLTITRTTAGTVTWAAPGAGTPFLAGTALAIGPDFFRASAADQISLLVEALAQKTKDIEPAFIPAYVSLAQWIHQHP